MRRILRVISAHVRVNLQQDLAYRVDTLVNIATMMAWLGYDLASIAVLFGSAQNINGWLAGDIIVLLGVFRMLNTLMMSIVWPNTELFNRGIREGTLDYVFVMPVNSQALISIRRIQVWQVVNVFVAAALILAGIATSGTPVSLGEAVSFLVLMVSGAALIYALWIVLISLTFWFTKFDNNVSLLQALIDTGRWPASVYPMWMRLLVTFVVPIAVATTVPVQALRGELSPLEAVGYFAVGVAGFGLASLVWRAGSRRYSGASS
ncbi:MAG: ABC-2 family transporter protein [Thermoflexales bacterium]|nr:ABC-2 family transporter protein [Thermoflexales bacterium]